MPSIKNLLLAMLLLTIIGCGRDSESSKLNSIAGSSASCRTDVAEWQEEVRLHDGQIVVVNRRAVACAGGFPNASRGRDLEFEFRYEPMNIHWKGKPSRAPVSFEIFNGTAYLTLYINDLASCQGQPPERYLAQFLKWDTDKWIEIPQSEFPTDLALLNLHSEYWGHTKAGDAKGLIPEQAKHTGGKKGDTIKAYFERGRRFCDFYQQ